MAMRYPPKRRSTSKKRPTARTDRQKRQTAKSSDSRSRNKDIRPRVTISRNEQTLMRGANIFCPGIRSSIPKRESGMSELMSGKRSLGAAQLLNHLMMGSGIFEPSSFFDNAKILNWKMVVGIDGLLSERFPFWDREGGMELSK